jgi:hypothetical protein
MGGRRPPGMIVVFVRTWSCCDKAYIPRVALARAFDTMVLVPPVNLGMSRYTGIMYGHDGNVYLSPGQRVRVPVCE